MLSDKYTLPIAWEVNEDLLSPFKCHDCPAMFDSITTHLTAPCGHPSSTPCVSGHGYHDDDQNSNIPQVVFAHRCQLEGWWDWQVPKPFELAPSWVQWLMHVHHLVINWVSWYEPILIYVWDWSGSSLTPQRSKKKTVVTWPWTLQSDMGMIRHTWSIGLRLQRATFRHCGPNFGDFSSFNGFYWSQ